jgi:beta-phosphoglucomutase-like phosphatase (HAD superfamily)
MRGLTLVFDLDGTLVDTAPDLIRAANHVLASEGLPAIAGDELRPAISFGARQMLATGLKVHGIRRSEAELDGLLDRFLAFYEANIAVESRPFPGIVEVLDHFRAEGAVIAVCTNKREQLSRRRNPACGRRTSPRRDGWRQRYGHPNRQGCAHSHHRRHFRLHGRSRRQARRGRRNR